MTPPGVTLLELQDWAGTEMLDAVLTEELGCGPPASVTEVRLTFWDTFDWRLWSAGLVLEHVVTADGRRRLRLREAGATDARYEGPYDDVPEVLRHLPEGPLGDTVRSVVGVRALLRCATTTVTATTRPYRNVVGSVVAEVTVTTASVSSGGALGETVPGRGLPLRVTVRGVDGYVRPFERIIETLRSHANPYVPGESMVRGTEPGAEPLVPAMWALGRRVGDHAEGFDVELRRGARAEDGLRGLLEHLVAVMERNAPGVRADLDIEFLHDFRVAVRRARTLLAGAKGTMPPALRERLRGEMKWLGDVTTPVRDLDVHLEELEDLAERGPSALPWGLGADLGPMHDVLRARRSAARAELIAALDSERYRAILTAFAAWFDGPPTPPDLAPHADEPMLSFASRRIAKAHRVLVEAGEAIDDDSPPEDLHELRKDAKRLRYYIEGFRGLHPGRLVDPAIKELRRLQAVLGDFQDTTVQVELILTVADDLSGGSPRALLAMGTLLADQSDRHDRSRAAFEERFERFTSKKAARRFARLGSIPAAELADARRRATASAPVPSPELPEVAPPQVAPPATDRPAPDAIGSPPITEPLVGAAAEAATPAEPVPAPNGSTAEPTARRGPPGDDAPADRSEPSPSRGNGSGAAGEAGPPGDG